MMRRTFKTIVGTVGLASVIVWSALAAEGPDKANRPRTPSLNRTAGTPAYQILNINNLWTWARRDGQSNHSPSANSGLYFPRGTSWAIYQDGFMWGGKAYLDANYTVPIANQLVRVGGATYNVGTQAGRVIGTGASAVPADPAPDDVRIYRIRRDYAEMSEGDLTRDAAESFEKLVSDVTQGDRDAIIAQYKKDWEEWPVAYGAPYIERNGTPGYQPPPANTKAADLIANNLDEPGIAGSDPNSPADQVIWTVFNDLNRSVSTGLYGSEPLGIEVQSTMWGYKRTDAMGNLYFKKFRFINKGGVDIGGGTMGHVWIDSMYVAQWADPDLGSFGDDLCGSDSVLSLGFVYNGNANDTEFQKFTLPPPAVGYDFLAGPLVVAPGDSAVFDLKRRYGYRNLPLTSFAWFAAGSDISDPPFTREGGLRWWKMLRGFVPYASTTPDVLYPHPPGFPPSFFPLSGGSGKPGVEGEFVDGRGTPFSFSPSDRRITLNSGPFRLAAGDTQEVVVGVVAGLGSDRLSSVKVMKFNDRFVQNTFDALFQVPKPPAPPDVKVAELDRQIVLEWGTNLNRVAVTETTVNYPGAYKFEGYNVYQLPSASSQLSDGRRIATFDLATDPTVVLDEQFDQRSGQILQLPVQFGTNSGITRYFNFNRDYVRDVAKLSNGQEYYLAVTAYSVASVAGYLPAALESDVQIFTVRPKVPYGTVYNSKLGDTLKVTHVAGTSDGIITPIVINPAASTGDTYRIQFDTAGGTTSWKVTNATKGSTVTSGNTNQSGDDNYDMLEASILLKVQGPLPGMKSWSIPNGTRRFSWAGGFAGLGLTGFGNSGEQNAYDPATGTIGAAGTFAFGGISTNLTTAQYRTVLLKLAPINATTLWDPLATPASPNMSRGYRFLRAATAPPAEASFAPWIINAAGGYPYQAYEYGVPFSAWDMETNPPTRLAVGHLENNVVGGAVDGRYWPPDAGGATFGGDNTVAREFAFIWLKPYTGDTPDPSLQVNISNNNTTPLMWVMVCNRRANVDWVDGDEFLITASHINTVEDVFEYTAPAPNKGVAFDKSSADKVGVFPNPYYAFNPAETNRLVRFVTFNNLPPQAKIRIFNLAGQLVRTLDKNDASQFMRWDLNNQNNFPVASGMYIAHLELTMPSDGSKVIKVLKMAVIQEQEVLDVF